MRLTAPTAIAMAASNGRRGASAARTRIASSRSRVVRMSGRPRPAVMRTVPSAGSTAGTPATIACSTDDTCSIRSRSGVDRRRAGGDAVRGVGDRADRLPRQRRRARRPGRADRWRSRRAPRAPRSRRPRAARRSSPATAAPRAGSGPDAAPAVDGRRPRTRPRRRSGPGSRRSAAARRRAPAPRRSTRPGATARSRPTRKRGPNERRIATPMASASTPTTIGSRGVTAATIAADRRAAARTWKGPKEPPRHVGVDAIAAVSIVRPLRADRYATGARRPAGQRRVIHECARAGSSYPPTRPQPRLVERVARSGRAPPRRRVERIDLAVEPGQDQPTADQLGRGDDVAVGDPPGDRPIGFEGERLDLRLDEDVPQPRRAEQADDRGRRAMLPAERRRSPHRVRRCGSRRPRPAAPRCPSRAPAVRRRSSMRTARSRTRADRPAGARRGTARPGRR